MLTIKREIKIEIVDPNFVEKEGSTEKPTSAFIYASMMGADEWLRYQQTLFGLDQTSISAYSEFRMDFAKSWIVRLEGFQFEDGKIVSIDDLGLLPASMLMLTHDKVLEAVSLGKSKKASQTTSTSPEDQE